MKKIVASIVLVALLVSMPGSPVIALEPPAPPSAGAPPPPPPPPAPPAEPTSPPSPFEPTPTSAPQPTDTPRPTRTPSPTSAPQPTPTVGSQTQEQQSQQSNGSPTVTPTPAAGNQTGNQTQDPQIGDTTITTGDATNSIVGTTTGNNNTAAVAPAGSGGEGATVVNTGNGAGSTNDSALATENTTTTVQTNSAQVTNDAEGESTTGKNTASDNLGGDVFIQTGDANVSGTLVNAVNTNAAGVMISEFNVVDDHVGDIILDFAAGCISGCPGTPAAVGNAGNGAYSDNTATSTTNNANSTFQTNDAGIDNALVLSADSGNNEANQNGGGDVVVKTGDANVVGNMVTLANNNIAGNVVYSTVNIYGNLYGDIIFPEEAFGVCCGTPVTAGNTGNGANSQNTATTTQNTTDQTYQYNTADLDNTLVLNGETGQNEANRNGGDGGVTVKTGDATAQANVVNIANNNVTGDNWWLVIVNEAGKWVGKIIGAEDDANYAAVAGTEFTVGENGEVTASNNGNQAGSTNTTTQTTTTNTTTVQANTADVNNTMDLSANTGNNSASDNIGGDVYVETGDATIIANIFNFVNNNFASDKPVVVVVVNVFKDWIGDFVAPGQNKQEDTAEQAAAQANSTGGTDVGRLADNASASNNAANSQESNDTSATNSNTASNDGDNNTDESTGLWGGYTPPSTSSLNETDTNNGHSVLAVFAGFDDDGTSATLSGSDDKKLAMVLGDSMTTQKQKKTIRINLAWLLALIPCGILFFAIRKAKTKKLNA